MTITPQIEEIVKQAQNLDNEQMQSLLWILLNKAKQNSIFSYQHLSIGGTTMYIIIPNKNDRQKDNLTHSGLKLGLLEGKISVPDDFNEPIKDFNEYMY